VGWWPTATVDHDRTVTSSSPPATVNGTTDPRFAAVADEFARNLAERGEVGASVHVLVDGEPVVDLWGGTTDPRVDDPAAAPWEADTAVVVYSSTKGATALSAIIQAQGVTDEITAAYSE
jgi:CubicO group peptidase (beta-lactamase class C family)